MSDVIIIGAGAVGGLTAMELVKRGARVTLVDRHQAGREASWAGGGILFPLLPWRYREEVNRLALAGMAAYPVVIEELRAAGYEPEYIVSGMEVHPEFDAEVIRAWCVAHDFPVEISADKVWLPSVAQVRNPRILGAIRYWLKDRGVRFVEHAEVASIEAPQGRISSINAGGERLQADQYVLTAGAWSREILGAHAIDRDLKPMRGQMLLYKTDPGVLTRIQYKNDFYLVPRRDGHILAGSTVEDVGFDKSTTEKALQELHRKAGDLLPVLRDMQPIQHWSGLRPGSPDNIPVIGRHPQVENLWLNTGHFRYGVTMGPTSARLLVDLMQGQPTELDPQPYAV
jgi:glycine oxidase